MAEVDAQAYAVTSANAIAGASNSVETQQPGGAGALRQVVVAGDAVTRANMQTIKAASTAAAAADMGAVVHLHPSSPMTQTDTTGTGTISATDTLGGTPGGAGVLISTAPTANSFVALALSGGTSQIDVQILGTATGTYYFEYSLDSTTGSDGAWVTGLFRQSGINNTVLTLGATTNGIFRGAAAAFRYFRLRNVGGTTPSNAITIRTSNGSGTTFLNAALPDGGNNIGAVSLTPLTGGTGGWTPYFANALVAPAGGVAISAAAGRFGGYMLQNLNSVPAYLQVFDMTAAVTLGTTTPTFVIPIPANPTAANGVAANVEFTVGINITNGIKVAATTTSTGATAVTTGLTGLIMYK